MYVFQKTLLSLMLTFIVLFSFSVIIDFFLMNVHCTQLELLYLFYTFVSNFMRLKSVSIGFKLYNNRRLLVHVPLNMWPSTLACWTGTPISYSYRYLRIHRHFVSVESLSKGFVSLPCFDHRFERPLIVYMHSSE